MLFLTCTSDLQCIGPTTAFLNRVVVGRMGSRGDGRRSKNTPSKKLPFLKRMRSSHKDLYFAQCRQFKNNKVEHFLSTFVKNMEELVIICLI